MIKSVVFFKRKAGMPVDEFQQYWRTRHPEVVLGLPGVRRYVQSHTLTSIYRTREPAYDGIAELWSESLDALRAMVRDPHYQTVKADEGRFIDPATMDGIVTREHVVKDGPAPAGGVKSIEFIRRRPDLPVEDFQRYWSETHGPIAATIPQIRRYVQSHALPDAYAKGRTPRWDGIAVTWFDDTAAMRAAATTPEYARTRADEPNLVAADEPPVIITREHVVV